jgi:hypothetical protein
VTGGAQVAGDPAAYSKAQISNFLKTSALNAKVRQVSILNWDSPIMAIACTSG